jgi:hypothetical protein
MNEVDKLRQVDIQNEVLNWFTPLLETHLRSMGPLAPDKTTIARQGLTAVYADLAKGFHAHAMGRHEEGAKHYEEAGHSFSRMRAKLEGQ